MREFVENECLIPSLAIGIPEDVFWKKTPKSLGIYFKAYQKQKEDEAKRWSQQAWEMGMYVKAAISTSIFVAGLYDGKHKPPEYPECPHTKLENNLSEKNEQWVKNERLRCYGFLKSLSVHK